MCFKVCLTQSLSKFTIKMLKLQFQYYKFLAFILLLLFNFPLLDLDPDSGRKMNADPRGSGYPPPLSVIVHFQSMTETLLLVPTITYLVWPVLWSSDNLGPNYKPQQSWQKKFFIFSRRKKTCDTFFVFVDILVEVGTHVVSCSIVIPRAKMEARQHIQNSNKIVE